MNGPSTTKRYEQVELGHGTNRVSVLCPEPDHPVEIPFIGDETLIADCLAAWMAGLHFRLEGPPGVGKNHLVYELARQLQRPLWILQGHADLEPQDLVCTPRLTNSGWQYTASPLVAAMRSGSGGILFLDEIGKLSDRAFSVLSSVLDPERRSISSVLAGFSLTAHSAWRFCAALNPSDPPLPDFIEKRLRPRFKVGHPPPDKLKAILETRFAGEQGLLREAFTRWAAENADVAVAPRDAITMVAFAEASARRRDLQTLTIDVAEDLIERAADRVLVRG